jgi:hypothetical protein
VIECIPGDYLTFRPIENPKTCRKEWNEQVDFIAWLREFYPAYAAMTLHPANEGDILPQYRQQQIKAGLLKGASDVIILKSGACHASGLIELKRCWRKSRPTPEQCELLRLATDDGKFSAVAHGADAAKAAFLFYATGLLHGYV